MMTINLIASQVICLMILTIKVKQNADSFAAGKTIIHWLQWLTVALLVSTINLILCHWTKYYPASLILSAGWGLPYFNIILNLVRHYSWDHLGEGKGSAVTDLILDKAKNYLALVYVIWLSASICIFLLIIK